MSKETVYGIVVSSILFAGVAGYLFYGLRTTGNEQKAWLVDETTTAQGQKTNTSGIVSVLAQTQTPNQSNQAQDTEEPQVASATDEVKSLKIVFPKEWKKSEKSVSVASCDSTKKASTQTYTVGSKTIVMYENSTPAGCDNKTVGDTSGIFTYDEVGAVKVIKKDMYKQCTKQENPTCPKGDGKLTVFATSIDEKKNEITNPFNKNTYAFRLEDTNIDPDFSKQVASLLGLIDQISFEYE